MKTYTAEYFKKMGRKGGKIGSAKLTKEQLVERARKAGKAKGKSKK